MNGKHVLLRKGVVVIEKGLDRASNQVEAKVQL